MFMFELVVGACFRALNLGYGWLVWIVGLGYWFAGVICWLVF